MGWQADPAHILTQHTGVYNKQKQRGATTRPQDAINALDVVLKEVRVGGCVLFAPLCTCWIHRDDLSGSHNKMDRLAD